MVKNFLEKLDKANFDRSQACGLCALILISLRENTTIAYQHKEWGFNDIPEEIVHECDELYEEAQLILVNEICSILNDNTVGELLETVS